MISVYLPDGELAYAVKPSQLKRMIGAYLVRVEYRPSGKPKRATLRARDGDARPITLAAYGTRFSYLDKRDVPAGVWTLKPSRSIGRAPLVR